MTLSAHLLASPQALSNTFKKPVSSYAVVGVNSSPYVVFYSLPGWTKLADPATLPANAVERISFSKRSQGLVSMVHPGSPFITTYQVADRVKLANPSTLPPGIGRGVEFHPNMNACLVFSDNDSHFQLYDTTSAPWASLTVGAANPALSLTSRGIFSPTGRYLLAVVFGSPSARLYQFDGEAGNPTTTWGQVSIDTLSATWGKAGAWSPNDALMAVAATATPYVGIWETSGWTRLANPGTLPTGAATGVAFSPNGLYLAVAHATSPYITVYRTTDWSKVTNPATLPTGDAYGCDFSADGAYLAVAHDVSPYITIYDVATWTKIADPATLPTSAGLAVRFSPGEY